MWRWVEVDVVLMSLRGVQPVAVGPSGRAVVRSAWLVCRAWRLSRRAGAGSFRADRRRQPARCCPSLSAPASTEVGSGRSAGGGDTADALSGVRPVRGEGERADPIQAG